jgi:Helix-turn-helix domain
VSHPRELRDPRTLRAVAHPVRLALLDLLERHGTLTSAEASAETGESTGSCSFHLRQLAKYGFIEPVRGRDARERRWRRTREVERVPGGLAGGAQVAAAEVGKLLVARFAAEAEAWLDRRHETSPEWQEAGVVDSELLYLTDDELRELGGAVVELFAAYRGRTTKPELRPGRSRPVRAGALLFPLPE